MGGGVVMGGGYSNYDDMTIGEIKGIIEGADLATLDEASKDFKTAADAIMKIPEDLATKAEAVAGVKDVWTGEAADAFLAFQTKVGQFIQEANAPAEAYSSALDTAHGGLDTAEKNMTNLWNEWMAQPEDTDYEEEYNEAARVILRTLRDVYVAAGNSMGDLAETPKELKEMRDPANKAKEEADDGKEEEKGGKEEEKGGKEEEKGGKEENANKEKDGEGGKSGNSPSQSKGPEDGKGPKEDANESPKDSKPPSDTAKGKGPSDSPNSEGKSGFPPSSPGVGGKDGGGSKDSKSPGKDSPSSKDSSPSKDSPSSKDSPPSKTGFPPSDLPKSNLTLPPDGPSKGFGDAPISDSNRVLPDAPVKEFPGRPDIKGIDVDKDGDPDIGFDGKPLKGDIVVGPDGKLGIDVDGDGKPDIPLTIGKDGKIGVDVDGDGKPDIGLDGEILDTTPLVQGPDGTIGIDVDGDGKPDIAISGQVLPDAPIKTFEGVRGVDVDGDGKPDLGMDRRPTKFATIIEKDGLRGVDVDGDGKPDIGEDGQIFEKNAPIAISKDGIRGVDVNNDGKPDIALTGGQSVEPLRFPDAIPSPRLPFEFPGVPVEPRIPGISPIVEPPITVNQPSNDYASLYSIGQPDTYNVPSLRVTTGDFDDPGTTLTSLGPLSPTPLSAPVAPTPVVDPIGTQAIGSPSSTLPGLQGVVGGISSRYTTSAKAASQADADTYLTGGASVPVEPPPGPTPVRAAAAPLTPYLGGMAGGVYGGDSDAKKAERQTKLVEDDDVWRDSGAVDDSLGRPRK